MSRRLIAVLALGTALLAGCDSGGQGEPAQTTTGPTASAQNFSGSGTATLTLEGTTYSFEVACESTQGGDEGRLLVAGSGEGPTGDAVSVSLDVSLADGQGSAGANLGGDPPRTVQADSVTADFGPPLVATGEFGDAGAGTLTVEGCSPE